MTEKTYTIVEDRGKPTSEDVIGFDAMLRRVKEITRDYYKRKPDNPEDLKVFDGDTDISECQAIVEAVSEIKEEIEKEEDDDENYERWKADCNDEYINKWPI